MSAAELQYIRALLIAQTANPEPRVRRGPFGWLSPKLAAPRAATPAAERPVRRAAPRIDPAFADADQELLLEALCPEAPTAHGPAAGDPTAIAPHMVDPLASPLPLPPRPEFGRRSDGEGLPDAEPELVLDHTMDIFTVRPAGGAPEAVATPFFPEDLMEPVAAATPPAPEPLRPWIKALRKSGAARPAEPQPAVQEPAVQEPAPVESPPLVIPSPESLPTEAIAPAPPPAAPVSRRRPRPAARPSRSIRRTEMRANLEALATRLAREQEILADRLLIVAAQNLFADAA